jgi:hypothetical protein
MQEQKYILYQIFNDNIASSRMALFLRRWIFLCRKLLEGIYILYTFKNRNQYYNDRDVKEPKSLDPT